MTSPNGPKTTATCGPSSTDTCGGSRGSTNKNTQCARLLRTLQAHPEGVPHRDLYRNGRYGIVHSRGADLRLKGYDVRCERKGADYVWRLVA